MIDCFPLIPNDYNSKKSSSLSSLIGFPNLSLKTALNTIGAFTIKLIKVVKLFMKIYQITICIYKFLNII